MEAYEIVLVQDREGQDSEETVHRLEFGQDIFELLLQFGERDLHGASRVWVRYVPEPTALTLTDAVGEGGEEKNTADILTKMIRALGHDPEQVLRVEAEAGMGVVISELADNVDLTEAEERSAPWDGVGVPVHMIQYSLGPVAVIVNEQIVSAHKSGEEQQVEVSEVIATVPDNKEEVQA